MQIILNKSFWWNQSILIIFLQNSQAVVLDVPVQYEDLEVIVNYFYRGTVLVELHNVERLLAAAVALEIDGLRDV